MKYDQRTTHKQARQDNSRLRKRIQQDDSKQQVTRGAHRKERCRQRTGSAVGLAAAAAAIVEKNQSNEIYLMKSPPTNYIKVSPLPLPTKMLLLSSLLLSLLLLLLLLPDGGLAQCPWTRDSAELHSDCICDFNPSLTTNLEHQQHQINRMSVQCAPVDFNHLLQALKQTASIELPVSLAHQLDISTSGYPIDESGGKVQQQPATVSNGSGISASNEEELREFGLQLASQAKLDLLHVSNSTIGRLERNSFILDVATSSLGAGARNQLLAPIQEDHPKSIGSHPRLLVVAIQSLHLSRCKIELIAPGAFNGLEWSLTSLSLSDNQLEFVPTGALQRLINLRVLDLSNNRIQLLAANSFVALTKLNTLRLADNRIGGHQAAPQPTATTQAARQQQEVSSGWFEFSAGSRGEKSSVANQHGDSGNGSGGASGLDQMAFAGLEMSLTDLNLKNTQLDVFPMAIKRLTRLAFLNLAQNQISNIPGRSFALMSSLTAINLERNRISNIEDDTFYGIEESLSSLSLLGNLLETFPVQQLSKLVSLRRLDMGFNEIETLPSNAFQSNKRLILIALDGNPLETLPELAFKPLEGTLRGMSIGGKALDCDCRLSWMLRWQQEFNIQISSRERQPQFCAKPHYLRSLVSFSALKPEHLTCTRPHQLQYPSSSHHPNYSHHQVSILPRNSTSNAWTANVNQLDSNAGGGGGTIYAAAGTTGSVPETTTSSQIISGGSSQQQQVSTVPYFTLPIHFGSSSATQPLTTTTMGQTVAPSDLSPTPTPLNPINKPTTPIFSTQAATLNDNNGSSATIVKDTSNTLSSPPDDSVSEQSTIVATTMMSTQSSTSQQPASRNPVVVVPGTNGQFPYSTNAFINGAGPDLVESGIDDETTRRLDADADDDDVDDSTETSEPATQQQATATAPTIDPSPTIPEPPSSFGERKSKNGSTSTGASDINQQQQQFLGNSVSSLPDDELFLQTTDTNYRKLNRQGYVAQGAHQNRLPAPGGEPNTSDEVLRRHPPTVASARTTSPIINLPRRNNTTTRPPISDSVGAASEPGKRLRPIFGNRAAGGDGSTTMVAAAATTTTTQQRWEHRRSSPSPGSIGLKVNSGTKLSIGGGSGGGSGSQSVVPAVPSTISVYKPTMGGGQVLTPAQTLNDQPSQVAVPMAGQRLNSTPTNHLSADQQQQLSKGARFVDSSEGGDQQPVAPPPVVRIKQNQANNNRFRQFNNNHRHQQQVPTGSSQVVVNSTRQLIDSNVERHSSASSSSGVQSSRTIPTAISAPSPSSSSDPLGTTQSIQLNRIQADSLPATTAITTTTTTKDEPLDTSHPTGNPRILPNNTRMSVSSMYRLSRPSTVPLTQPSSTTTTTTPAPVSLNSTKPSPLVASSNHLSGSKNADQHRYRHHHHRHLVSSTSPPPRTASSDGSSTNQVGPSLAPSSEVNKAEATTRMAATVRIVDSLTAAPTNFTEVASGSTSTTTTTSTTTAKPANKPNNPNQAATAAASEVVPISVEPVASSSNSVVASTESGRNDDDNRLLQRFDNQPGGQIESIASSGQQQHPSNRTDRGVQSSSSSSSSPPPPPQTGMPETFGSLAENSNVSGGSGSKMVQENTTHKPHQSSTGSHLPTLSGSGSSSSRPLLVTRNSFNQQQQAGRDDLMAFGGVGGHQGIGSARIFGRFIRLPDFDQMALILAAILCLFILTMALTVICVCYSSYSASNSGCSSGSLSCKLPAKASRLSSFSSSDESSSVPNTNSHETTGLQHQLSNTRLESSKSSQLLRNIFCCWLSGPNRVAAAAAAATTSGSHLRKTKRLTHMRSLILQDDEISSGSSGVSQPLASGLKVTTASGSPMLLAPATGSRRQDTLGDQELLFHTLKAASIRCKEPWAGSHRQHQSNRKANNVSGHRGGFDNAALEDRFVGPTKSAGKLQREASLHRREPSSYAEQHDYFMGLRRSLSMAHRSENLAAGGSSKQLLQVSSGPDPETLSSGSCDSDKSCSPGANKNNRYNISDAHRAYMASNKGAHQIQASMFVSSTPSSQVASAQSANARQSGLLQAIDDQQQQHQQHHQVEYFDGRLSSDKSTTDDGGAPSGNARRLDHDFRLLDNQVAHSTAKRGTKSFGTALKRSLRRSRQDVKQQVAAAPNERAPSGCEQEYMSSELVPMSAEEQWPEPYLDPADEQQQQQHHHHQPQQVSFDCKESQFVQYRPEATNYMMPLNKQQQQQQHQKLHLNHHHHQQKQQHRSQNLFPMMEQEVVGHRRLSQSQYHSGTMLKTAASGPHDDMYLATNWHTARRTAQRPLNKSMQSNENHSDYPHHPNNQNNNSSSRRHHHKHHHEQRLAHDDTDSHINGTSNNPNNASLLRYRSIPSLNNVPVDHMGPGKAFLASQIVGATNWLRWTPTTNFQASCGDDRVAFGSSQDNASSRYEPPQATGTWNRDNQVESMYVATGQHKHLR